MSLWGPALALAVGGAACSSLDETTKQCATDRDCVRFGTGKVCAAQGRCVSRVSPPSGVDASAPAGDAGPGPGGDASAQDAPVVGVLASISVDPPTPNLLTGRTQQFTATGKDGFGAALSPQPAFTWTVSGGGTISVTGLFTAGDVAGGPFVVRATSGALSGVANPTVSVSTVLMGETNILNVDDSGNGDLLLAQQATLAKPATIRSLSFYVALAAGNLRLGVYDATGPGNGPGAKKAETAEFAAAAGWNTVNVVTPVALAAGDYWLAYAPSDSNLHFERAGDNTGMFSYYALPYGPMPATFSTTPMTGMDHWSFYATLTE